VRAQAQRVIDAQPRSAQALFYQGCLAYGAQGAGKAADLFERAVKVNDRSSVYHLWLGRAYGDQAQRANVLKQASLAKKTKSHFERAVELDPNNLDARLSLIDYYVLAPGIMGGSVDKAQQQAEEIRRRNPYRGGFAMASVAQRGRKDAAAAQRELETLIQQYPDSTAPWFSLLASHRTAKQYDRAWALVERMGKAKPGHRTVQFLIGSLAGETGQQLDRGEQALKSYLAYTPKDDEPKHASAHYRLGQIYEHRNQKDQARTSYQAALAENPELKSAKDALAKLK
jgi:tetratricopeptide (TPR) repeat protein